VREGRRRGEERGEGGGREGSLFLFRSSTLSPSIPSPVDYENRRPEFIGVFVNELINWDVVAERYAAAGGK
jgi:hypothetical protein